MNDRPITPSCADCGRPTTGEYYNDFATHYCNRCGERREQARFSRRALILFWITRPLFYMRRAWNERLHAARFFWPITTINKILWTQPVKCRCTKIKKAMSGNSPEAKEENCFL
jgi:hypothetical protein